MDAEGYIGFRRSGTSAAYVEIASCDIGILRTLHQELNAREMPCQIRLKQPAGTVNKRGQPMNRDFYCLGIYSKGSLDNFLRGIRPQLKHKDKCTALERAMANIRKRGLE